MVRYWYCARYWDGLNEATHTDGTRGNIVEIKNAVNLMKIVVNHGDFLLTIHSFHQLSRLVRSVPGTVTMIPENADSIISTPKPENK